MKKPFILLVILLLSAAATSLSCKKEKTCDGCNSINKPPVAFAGNDVLFAITSAADSFTLNGMQSTDPDGSIVSYQWLRISGPTTMNVSNGNSGIATAKRIGSGRLESGIYHFELIVRDNDGAYARDSVLITVVGAPTGVNAGNDQIVLFPGFTGFNLTGRADANAYFPVQQFEWTSISAPQAVVIETPNGSSTNVRVNTAGIYLFRFRVTNTAGISTADTVQVTVNNDNLSGQEFIFNNIVWDYESNGNYELEIFTPEQIGVFYSASRPMQVSVKTGSGIWIPVPDATQPNSNLVYWIYPSRLYVFSRTFDPSLFGVTASIKVRFL